MDRLRILVVDDHEEFRTGLKALLAASTTSEVVGTATNGVDAVSAALTLQPDIVLMDLQMPRLNGIEATEQIVGSSPHIGVLVLTMMEDDDSVFAAVRAGARGYLLKGARRAEIVRSIEAVGAGEVIFGPGIAERVMSYFRGVPNRQSTAGSSRSSPNASGTSSPALPKATRTSRSPDRWESPSRPCATMPATSSPSCKLRTGRRRSSWPARRDWVSRAQRQPPSSRASSLASLPSSLACRESTYTTLAPNCVPVVPSRTHVVTPRSWTWVTAWANR